MNELPRNGLIPPRIRPMALCKADLKDAPVDAYPFNDGDKFVFLGEIEQMPGHCVVVRLSDNKIFTCYHTDSFVELTEDEI